MLPKHRGKIMLPGQPHQPVQRPGPCPSSNHLVCKGRHVPKNHNLGLEVPYRYGSELRRYLPDFIVLVDDGHGDGDPLHLVVEIKGYRREDAKEKKATMDTYWVPGVNNLGTLGRWSFAELTEIYQIESDFNAKVESAFAEMIARAGGVPPALSA